MAATTQRIWETGLRLRLHDRHTSSLKQRKIDTEATESKDEEHRSGIDGNASRRRVTSKNVSTTISSSEAPGADTEADAAAVSAVSEDEEADNCCDLDKFRLIIPWFGQIGETLEVLGQGRSSQVSKVTWDGRRKAVPGQVDRIAMIDFKPMVR